jgi:hypothetical protein
MKDLLKKLVGTEPPTMLLATVKAVDEAAATCDCEPLDDSAELFGVALRSIADNNTTGEVVYPKVESIVLVAVLNHATGSAVVVRCGGLDKKTTKIGTTRTEITDNKIIAQADNIEINGGQNGGLVKSPELEAQLAKTHNLLTALITAINGAPALEAGNGAPSVLQQLLKAAIVGQQLGVFTSLQNDKFKH